MFKVAILAIFILFYAKVNSQDTSDTLEVELSVNGTVANDQNSTETRPGQCRQTAKDYFLQFMNTYFNEVRIIRIHNKITKYELKL